MAFSFPHIVLIIQFVCCLNETGFFVSFFFCFIEIELTRTTSIYNIKLKARHTNTHNNAGKSESHATSTKQRRKLLRICIWDLRVLSIK